MKLTWNDPEEIAHCLCKQYAGRDPLTLRFTELHKMVTELEGFDDDPVSSSEGKLEAIQMAWLEEYQGE